MSTSFTVNCFNSSSSWVFIIFFWIGLSATSRGFLSSFLKCSFHFCIFSSWLASFSFVLTVLFLLLTSFNHHHHHIALVARISLTLSRHSSLSFIALGRSSGQHPVSSHSCWMYVRAGRPAFARPCVGIHKSTSLMSSSLLLQQCPACLSFNTGHANHDSLCSIEFLILLIWPYRPC